MTTPIGGLRVLIIGKDVLVRSGLQTVLSNRSEIKVIGLVDESDPAEQMVDLYQPDVLIWDGGSAPDC
jgi:DNA-binding NarL/FixJ family response regulator